MSLPLSRLLAVAPLLLLLPSACAVQEEDDVGQSTDALNGTLGAPVCVAAPFGLYLRAQPNQGSGLVFDPALTYQTDLRLYAPAPEDADRNSGYVLGGFYEGQAGSAQTWARVALMLDGTRGVVGYVGADWLYKGSCAEMRANPGGAVACDANNDCRLSGNLPTLSCTASCATPGSSRRSSDNLLYECRNVDGMYRWLSPSTRAAMPSQCQGLPLPPLGPVSVACGPRPGDAYRSNACYFNRTTGHAESNRSPYKDPSWVCLGGSDVPYTFSFDNTGPNGTAQARTCRETAVGLRWCTKDRYGTSYSCEN